MIDPINDIPEWIIDRYKTRTIGPGMSLVSMVCIQDMHIYSLNNRKAFDFKFPHIYFAALDLNYDWAFAYSDPQGVGYDMKLSQLRTYFKILEKVF